MFNLKIFPKNIKLKISLFIIIVFLIIMPNVLSDLEYDQDNLQKSTDLIVKQQIYNESEWKQITDNGFGKKTNLATRGMAVYNDELYIGTQNVKLPKLFEDRFPGLFENISKLLPNILPKFLNRILFLKAIYQLKHHISDNNFRTLLHLIVRRSEGCEIWKYNYTTDSLTQVVGDNSVTGMKAGFNYTFNCLATVIIEFKGKLYVGTWNTPIGSLQDLSRKGAEIWRFDGKVWEQVVGNNAIYTKGGFGNFNNAGISSMEVFNGYLYAGTMNWGYSIFGGCEIWRTQNGLQWEKVVSHGFKQNMSLSDLLKGVSNTYVWNMEVFQNQLYAGTFNSCYRFFSNGGMGCQLWRTSCGKNWTKVDLPTGIDGVYQDGFGDPGNYGIRTMVVYNDELYVGTAANLIEDKGCEIWKYNGSTWIPIISANAPSVEPGDITYSGFGNPLNKYAWSMAVTSDNKLYVGTANGKFINLMEPKTNGCEIWCYDGTEWIPIVKDDVGEKSNGFGNIKNEGARSIIEYPRGSGNIVVGTFKLISTRALIPQQGCSLWMRIV
jgi:hypothetical protein